MAVHPKNNRLKDKPLSKPFHYRYLWFIVILLVPVIFISGIGNQQTKNPPSPYLEAVQTFAENVLENGRDQYGELHSPLFVDGIETRTGNPVRWKSGDNNWIISNFGSQQNLMRVFVGLSTLTGENRYRDAAEETVRYMFSSHSDDRGLLYWGGHQFIDLETMENQFKGRPHELKNNYPFYEFLWENEPEATERMLKAMWNAHILDWGNLDLNRHGEYDLPMGKLWDHEFHQSEPFFEGRGLTFINAGTDMIQAALSLYAMTGEEDAKTWGVRLYEQYVRARHPKTNLGVYQYSRPTQRDEPPAEGPLTGEHTFSRYGDRAANQFGDKYGSIALEGNVLWGSRVQTLYGQSPVMLLHLAEQLEGTTAGTQMLNWTLEGLRALAKHVYDPEKDHFRPMWADGTDLTGDVYPRTGYYGDKGTPFKAVKPNTTIMLAVAKALRLSEEDPLLWNMMRHMFIGKELGDPGENFEAEPNLNLQTDAADATLLVALLELYQLFNNDQFLRLAERLGDNILGTKYFDGYFKASEDHKYTRFDSPEPLALLMLEATRQGTPKKVPSYLTGEGSTDGEPDDEGRPSDELIYEETYND